MIRLTFVVLLSLCAIACRNSILFTTSTTLGVDLSTTAANAQGVKVGFQREAGVFMPERTQLTDKGEVPLEAYPVLAIYDMETGSFDFTGLGTLRVRQVFASGRAAVGDGATKATTEAMSALTGVQILTSSDVEAMKSLQSKVDGANESQLTAIYERLNTNRSWWADDDGEGGLEVTKIESKELVKEAIVSSSDRGRFDELSAALLKILKP